MTAPSSPTRSPQPASGSRLLAAPEEARLFWRLRWQLTSNTWRQAFENARLRVSLVTLLTGMLWVGLFGLFAEGFQFLSSTIPDPVTHDETARAVFSIFFVSLSFMLVLSTAIIIYGGLFRSPEVRFLFSLPVRIERVFLHKFQEAILFSSWGFLLLGTPMLAAYGVVEEGSWYYFLAIVPFMLSFVYIPGSLGAILVLVIVRWLPGNRRRLIWLGIGAAVCIGAAVAWSIARNIDNDLLTPAWFQEMLARLRFSETRLLPSWWLSSGLLEAVHAGWQAPSARLALSESVMFLALTISNALFLHQLAVWTAGALYRSGFSALHAERPSRRRLKPALIDTAVMRAAFFLTPKMRLLIVKDLRLFRRDPVQWLQFLIFFGLLALYFLNIRRLSYDINYVSWVNMISFLNLAVVGLILSTFTTRFIFPMISLEGRRFWILGLLPIRRETILWGKFLFAAVGSMAPSTLLILLSDFMLRVSSIIVVVHVLACLILCSGLSGIAVGLGAKMPNLRDDSPSRIAAGFGGTLNLVISTAYIAAVVTLTAVPCHFYLAAAEGISFSAHVTKEQLWNWLLLGVAGSVVLGIIATAAPLAVGFKAFRELEF
jgi:ABC-2 type transport system permease protein